VANKTAAILLHLLTLGSPNVLGFITQTVQSAHLNPSHHILKCPGVRERSCSLSRIKATHDKRDDNPFFGSRHIR